MERYRDPMHAFIVYIYSVYFTSIIYHVMWYRMKLMIALWLLLATLVGVSVQQCTLERFEMVALDRAQNIVSESSMITAINDTFYNCLSASEIIGVYETMSVSLLYTISDDPTNLREVRFNMDCFDNDWEVFGSPRQLPTALRSNDTRTNCSACTNRTVNEYHCTR